MPGADENWPPLRGVSDFLDQADCRYSRDDWRGFMQGRSWLDPWERRNRVLAESLVRQLS